MPPFAYRSLLHFCRHYHSITQRRTLMKSTFSFCKSGDLVETEIRNQDLMYKYHIHDIKDDHNVLVIQPILIRDLKAGESQHAELMLDESVSLIRTLGWTVGNQISIGVSALGAQNLFSYENMLKLKDLIQSSSSSVRLTTIFISQDQVLPRQRAELEESFGLPILDRYNVVLKIFRKHSSTKEAKLQVALAEIPYLKQRLMGDRLLESDKKHDKSRLGETYFEKQEMRLKKKECDIKREMMGLKAQRQVLRKSRIVRGTPTIAVVGYTNSGKTSLIKAVTGTSKLKPEDKLFATLDVTSHLGILQPSQLPVLFLDTVGFISDVPINLIASFSSTLEDVVLADLIIHVRDMSHPENVRQNENVIQTLLRIFRIPLTEIERKMIVVSNKIDKVEPDIIKLMTKTTKSLPISVTKNFGLDILLRQVEDRIIQITDRKYYTLKVKTGGVEYRWIRQNFPVSGESTDENDPNYSYIRTILRESDFNKYRSKFS